MRSYLGFYIGDVGLGLRNVESEDGFGVSGCACDSGSARTVYVYFSVETVERESLIRTIGLSNL